MRKDSKKEISRRKAVKTMAIGGVAVTSAVVMPERWGKPIVESVVLPAHAKLSSSDAP